MYGRRTKLKGISKSDFRRLLQITTKGTVFYFNGYYFRQIDGVAMGSPLGPHLANAFLCYHESTWLDNCPLSYAPILYARYVDDIFVLMRSKESILHLVNYLNSKHLNIRFTWEEEKDDKMAFLDVCVYRTSGGFTTSIHRKSTFSGVYTNYESFIPIQYKIGLVSTLLHRAYMISSNYQLLHEEIVKLKEILKCNGYPGIKLDKIIFRFLEKIYTPSVPITTVPRKIVTLVLPFMGTMSLDVKKKLSKSFKECVPLAKLQIVFKTNNRMSSWFRYKDVFPESLLSGVIYEYKCPRCNSRYQGSTFRHWE